MFAFRGFAASIAVASLSLTAQPAMAKAKPNAAAKLALGGAQAVSDCVTRADADGTWRQDSAGNWIRCRGGSGGLQAGHIIGGVAALGIIAAVATAGGDDDDRPSSP